MTYTEIEAHIEVENRVRRAEEVAEKRSHRQQKAKVYDVESWGEEGNVSGSCERSNVPSAMRAAPTPRRWLDADLPYGIGCIAELPKVHIKSTLELSKWIYFCACGCIYGCHSLPVSCTNN